MENILEYVNNITPLGVATISLFILFRVIDNNKSVKAIKDNHLTHVEENIIISSQKLDTLQRSIERLEGAISNHEDEEIRAINEISRNLNILITNRFK